MADINRSNRSGNGRNSYPGNSYYRRKRRREKERRIRMLVGGAAAVLVISLVVFGVRKFLRNGGGGTPTAVAESQSTEAITVESTELKKAVTIKK